MRWAGVVRPSGGASACVMRPRWECEQAAPCPTPSAGLSPGPSPICFPPPSLTVAAARLWKPASGQLCDRDSKSSAHWLPAAAAASGRGLGRATPTPNHPLASTWTWGKTPKNHQPAHALADISTDVSRIITEARKRVFIHFSHLLCWRDKPVWI